MKPANEATRYSAPALDKGLDIVELLATKPEGLALKQIADALGRTPTEIFRMLNHLHHREYVQRYEPGGIYRLSLKLFELAHRFPPTARLLEVALPEMRQLAERTSQSCHLSVLHADKILVLAQMTSTSNWHFSVRVGATFSLENTASGRVLMAALPEDELEELRQPQTDTKSSRLNKRLTATLETIRERGYEQVAHETFQGVTDISVPIIGEGDHVLAALTMPVLTDQRSGQSVAAVREQLSATAATISAQLGGHPMTTEIGAKQTANS